MQSYLLNDPKEEQKEFFITDTNSEQSVFAVTLPVFSFPNVIPRGLFSFSGTGAESSPNPRFKMILWAIIAGTRGGVNRAKILNLVKETPMNANKIATVLNLDHKTVIHHVKILAKNELIVKAEKDYGAEYQLTQIMKENQSALEEIMLKIGTK
ncbi:MAG: transcriptional regulator [Nitrosopumilales archaeon CG_4_9_14_0_2_um_filter_34_16]|jgi:DNA-binding transcriptional ArsR family regulator|nr:MAG: transcriptional regulator [Nitrosopumilales archaeon CG_4_9_14_0_2_um_filter_34_16]